MIITKRICYKQQRKWLLLNISIEVLYITILINHHIGMVVFDSQVITSNQLNVVPTPFLLRIPSYIKSIYTHLVSRMTRMIESQ